MATLKKYNYQLKTISKLVLSPREHQGYYLAAGDFEAKQVKLAYKATETSDVESIKIIYPFYQYGAYNGYRPQDTQYYIPGSSIKGAICADLQKPTTFKLMVDDIAITSSDSLKLNHLYKLQHASDSNEKQGKLELFFPNVAVEMLEAETECAGELFYDQAELKQYLANAQAQTIAKLEGLALQIDAILKLLLSEKTRAALEQVLFNVKNRIEIAKASEGKVFLLLLGGFKGLVLSGVSGQGIDKSAIYVDHDTFLPHGLVQLTLENC